MNIEDQFFKFFIFLELCRDLKISQSYYDAPQNDIEERAYNYYKEALDNIDWGLNEINNEQEKKILAKQLLVSIEPVIKKYKLTENGSIIFQDSYYTDPMRYPILRDSSVIRENYKYLNRMEIFLSEISQSQTSTQIIPSATNTDEALQKIKKSKYQFNSFKYVHLAKRPDCIGECFHILKDAGYLKCESYIFKKLFSGETLANRIVWYGQKNTLYYFIKALIYHSPPILENLFKEHWEVTCKCFEFENGAITVNQIKSHSDPVETTAIDKAVKILALPLSTH